jgi:hypothetical protein
MGGLVGKISASQPGRIPSQGPRTLARATHPLSSGFGPHHLEEEFSVGLPVGRRASPSLGGLGKETKAFVALEGEEGKPPI